MSNPARIVAALTGTAVLRALAKSSSLVLGRPWLREDHTGNKTDCASAKQLVSPGSGPLVFKETLTGVAPSSVKGKFSSTMDAQETDER